MKDDWYPKLIDRCKQKGINFLSTGFDNDSIDFLNDLQIPYTDVHEMFKNYNDYQSMEQYTPDNLNSHFCALKCKRELLSFSKTHINIINIKS